MIFSDSLKRKNARLISFLRLLQQNCCRGFFMHLHLVQLGFFKWWKIMGESNCFVIFSHSCIFKQSIKLKIVCNFIISILFLLQHKFIILRLVVCKTEYDV